MLPIEQTKLSTAISGPDEHVLDGAHPGGRIVEEDGLEGLAWDEADEAGDQEAESDLLPQHLPVAAEVVRDVRPRLHRCEALPPGALA
jgi:hypothetical protein